MKRFFKAVGVGCVGLVASATSSFAALDLTTATVNTADVDKIMGLAVPALLLLWGYRKVIKVANRS